MAFDANLDIARAVIFDAGGEFGRQVLTKRANRYADLAALFKLRADRFEIFAVHFAKFSIDHAFTCRKRFIPIGEIGRPK